MNKFKLTLSLGIVLVLVLLGTWGFLKYSHKNSPKSVESASGGQTPASSLGSANNQFQPEAQMLDQALTISRQAKAKSNTSASDTPVTAKIGDGPYEYKKSICQTTIDKHFDCLDVYYSGLVKAYGVDTAFKDLKQRFNEDSYVTSECHPIVHVIGRVASESYKTVSEAYLHGDSFCWSGYYHGILEGFIDRIGKQNLPTALNTICADIPGKETYNFNYYNCVHGIGHGLMETSQDELFDSLSMCDNLSGGWEQQSCYSGVYMENIIADGKSHTTKYLKPDQPLYPCTAVEQKYQYQCYLGQTSYALQILSYNFQKVFDLCATLEALNRDTCFQSLGRDAANQEYHDPAQTKIICSLAKDPTDKTNCMTGALKEIISYYHDITQANAYCDIQEDPDKQTCHQIADSYYKNF